MSFVFRPLRIPGLMLIIPDTYPDARGCFFETFKAHDFVKYGIPTDFVQDNHSVSKKGVLRGLHYQVAPAGQGKLVRVAFGRAWDVAVDLRRSSPYYLKWEAVLLNNKNNQMLYIPPGFAHGFVALSPEVTFLYKCTAPYSKEHERGIRWNDPTLNIQWPVANPILSERDAQLPLWNPNIWAE